MKTKIILGVFTFLGLLGFSLGSTTQARELNSGNVGDYCLTSATSCNIQSKGITSIASGTFLNHSNLQYLDLSYNAITSIEPGDFSGLDSLTKIIFYGNKITSIEPGGFAGLSGLTDLLLDNNKITTIDSGTFIGLDNLQKLSLSRNQLTNLNSGMWIGLDNLQYLQLYTNYITSLEKGDFIGMPYLVSLDLAYNPIATIDNGSFDGLENLTEINFYAINITELNSGFFEGIPNLEYLYLGETPILNLKKGTFDLASKLRDIDFWGNLISSIDIGVFSNLTNLNNLDLDKNCLNLDDPVLMGYLSTVTGASYSGSQYLCPIFNYMPTTPTDGQVTGFVIFTGGTSEQRDSFLVNNTGLIKHTWEANGLYSIYFTGDVAAVTGIIDDNSELVYVNNIAELQPLFYEKWFANGTVFPVTGKVDRIIPYIPPVVVSTKPTVGFAGGGGGGGSSSTPTTPTTPTTPITPTQPTTPTVSSDPEQLNAYKRAYNAGVTTQPTLPQARLENTINRGELAKMLAVYAKEQLKKTPDSTKACTYTDANTTSEELAGYMKTVCQLGIMGLQGDGKTPLEMFNPNEIVTRAQLVTTISRLLYGNKYDTNSENRWSGHMNILKSEGVVNKTDPTIVELRGWVMLMLYRLQ